MSVESSVGPEGVRVELVFIEDRRYGDIKLVFDLQPWPRSNLYDRALVRLDGMKPFDAGPPSGRATAVAQIQREKLLEFCRRVVAAADLVDPMVVSGVYADP